MKEHKLDELNKIIFSRIKSGDENSYTRKLAEEGLKRCAQKVGEEGVEVALAAVTEDKVELLNESADLLYHLLVLLHVSDLSFDKVLDELGRRMKP